MRYRITIMTLLIIVIVLISGVVDIQPEKSVAAPISSLLIAMQPQSVIIVDRGSEYEAYSVAETVGELLDEQNINLNPQDIVIPPTYHKLNGIMKISIIRVENAVITETIEVEAGELRVPDEDLLVGERVELVPGESGSETRQIEIVSADGQPVAERVLNVLAVDMPKDKIIAFGVKNTAAFEGRNVSLSRVLDVEATAYTAGFESTGKHPGHPEYGITASGLQVKEGHIAVDPTVIPLHSKVYIEGYDDIGNEYNGFYTATDTGSAIKGNAIDIYMEENDEAYRFGRRPMKVYIIQPS